MSRAVESFRAAFEALERERGRDPLHDVRRGGWERFAALGLPTLKHEEWRYTNLSPLARQSFALGRPSRNGIAPAEAARRGVAPGLVFVDGHFRADLSVVPPGIETMPLAEAMRARPELAGLLGGAEEADAFTALNTAFVEDGVFLRVPRGTRLTQPLHVLFLGTDKAAHPRNVYQLEDNAAAEVVETYASAGDAAHFTNAVSQAMLAPGASLSHYRLQLEVSAAYHVGALRVRLDRDSRFVSHAVTFGGALTRNDITASLEGEGSHCTLNGLFVARGTQHVDNHTRIEHRKPNCESHELYKGILDDRASGVFCGRIHVFEDAQKTDAFQASANLLLSDEAEVDSQPQLEIYADDVKCSHGSTVGQLDREALFYLRTRGLPEKRARLLLIRGFAGDVADRLHVEAVRERVDRFLTERLGGD